MKRGALPLRAALFSGLALSDPGQRLASPGWLVALCRALFACINPRHRQMMRFRT